MRPEAVGPLTEPASVNATPGWSTGAADERAALSGTSTAERVSVTRTRAAMRRRLRFTASASAAPLGEDWEPTGGERHCIESMESMDGIAVGVAVGVWVCAGPAARPSQA